MSTAAPRHNRAALAFRAADARRRLALLEQTRMGNAASSSAQPTPADTMIEDDYEAAVALATEFEQLRQREEADAELAADMAAGLGTLPGHLPGQEAPSTRAVKLTQDAYTVAMYDSQVASAAPLSSDVSRAAQLLPGDGKVRVVSVPRLNEGTSQVVAVHRTSRSKRSAAAGPSSAPPADAEGQCSSCSAPASEVPALFRLPCNHVYCDVCMRQVLHQASLNAGRLPLRCCRVAHDDKFARALLEGERGQVYSRLRQAALAPIRFDCPRCHAFIDVAKLTPHMEGSIDFACSCGQRLCLACRSVAHPHITCQQFMTLPQEVRDDPSDYAAVQYIDTQGWKRCPRCRYYVERTGGCTAMSCRCGAQWQYT